MKAQTNQTQQVEASWYSLSRIKQQIGKLTWKQGLLLLIPAFVIYPRPFLFVLNPIIRRVRNSYRRNRPKLEKLVFTTNRQLTGGRVVKQNLYSGDSSNVYPQHESSASLQKSVIWNEALSKQPNLFLQAENAVLRIKMLSLEIALEKTENFVILIKGSPELLRVVEAKVYGMDSHEYYKIPMFRSHSDIHILESTAGHNSFEQKIMTIKE